MTDLINPANWGGAQWVLVTMMLFSIAFKAAEVKIKDHEWIGHIIGCILMFALLAWGGFWA